MNSSLSMHEERGWAVAYSEDAEVLLPVDNAVKIGVVTGISWQNGPCVGNSESASSTGLPTICLQDGPPRLRFTRVIAAFLAAIHAGSTWDKELLRSQSSGSSRCPWTVGWTFRESSVQRPQPGRYGL